MFRLSILTSTDSTPLTEYEITASTVSPNRTFCWTYSVATKGVGVPRMRRRRRRRRKRRK
jgi:hypothetical protein